MTAEIQTRRIECLYVRFHQRLRGCEVKGATEKYKIRSGQVDHILSKLHEVSSPASLTMTLARNNVRKCSDEADDSLEQI